MKEAASVNMLRNLARYVEQMELSKEENQLFQNRLKIQSLLKDPVLKLIAIE